MPAVKGGTVVGLLICAYMFLQVVGLQYTTASKSALITGISVVLVPVFSAFILKKVPDVFSILGVALAMSGLLFLAELRGFNLNFGDLLTLGCAVLCAIHILSVDHFTMKFDPKIISLLQFAVCAVLYLTGWIVTGFQSFVINTQVVLALLITGVFGTAVAYTVWAIVQQDTTPTKVALIFTCEPVFGVVLALIIPRNDGTTEKMTINMLLGCVLIVAGMILAELKPKKSKPKKSKLKKMKLKKISRQITDLTKPEIAANENTGSIQKASGE